MIIDVHTSFIPRGFFHAARRGRQWYGASLGKEASGKESLMLAGGSFLLFDGVDVWAAPEKRISIQKEQEGIDVQLLSVPSYLWNYHLDAETGAAYCREVNEELAELEKAYPENFLCLAMLPWQDTGAALKELEHAVKDLGLRTVSVATNVDGRNLDDPRLLPIFEAAASAGVLITSHPTYQAAGHERMSGYAFRGTIGVPLETTIAIMSLIFGGVLDKCPDLKICFYQGGGYAVTGIGRLSHGYHTKSEAHTMERPPEEYLGLLYYDCLTHNPDSLRVLIDRVSAEHVLLGTDFPMGDGIVGGTVAWIKALPFLSESDKQNILGANAARLLDIPTR